MKLCQIYPISKLSNCINFIKLSKIRVGYVLRWSQTFYWNLNTCYDLTWSARDLITWLWYNARDMQSIIDYSLFIISVRSSLCCICTTYVHVTFYLNFAIREIEIPCDYILFKNNVNNGFCTHSKCIARWFVLFMYPFLWISSLDIWLCKDLLIDFLLPRNGII